MTGDQEALSLSPSTPEEFGRGLRALRTVSLRTLAERQAPRGSLVLSKSQLDRYEKGLLPPLKYAQHLDDLYEARGWVIIALRGLWRSSWDPWGMESAANTVHADAWPPQYSGMVWIKIKPLSENAGELHHFLLHWGIWSRCVKERPLGEAGLVLMTGKAKDLGGLLRTPATSHPAGPCSLFMELAERSKAKMCLTFGVDGDRPSSSLHFHQSAVATKRPTPLPRTRQASRHRLALSGSDYALSELAAGSNFSQETIRKALLKAGVAMRPARR